MGSAVTGYSTTLHPDQAYAKRIVNPRRGVVQSVPGLSNAAACRIGDELFRRFGPEDLVGCVSAEMRSRPVPHVFREEEVLPLVELYHSWSDRIYPFLLRQLKPPVQTFNRTSRLGWPYFRSELHKRSLLQGFFSRLEREGVSCLDDSFIVMNVRLQAESTKKKRDFLFVDDHGAVSTKQIDSSARRVITRFGPRIASRTRLVFNLPVANLYKQVLDTALHNVLLEHPAFHHDLYTPGGTLPVTGRHLCFDVKHFERHTAGICRARGATLGGLYGDIVAKFAKIPFLAPSDTWKSFWFLTVNRSQGWSDQYASGDSAVAPAQKEVFLALYAEFAKRALHLNDDAAIAWVCAGGDRRLTIRNYGDDNSINGDAALVEDCFQFMKQYLTVEEEDPPRFLGFEYTHEGWRLNGSSYLSKTYLNERTAGSSFRRYPNFGWVEKRKVYTQLGKPEVARNIFPTEDALLAGAGLPWRKVLLRARKEEETLASRVDAWRSLDLVLEKTYRWDAERKIASGLFDGMYPAETAIIIKRLIGATWKGVVPWL